MRLGGAGSQQGEEGHGHSFSISILLPGAAAAEDFGFAQVRAREQELAARPYELPSEEMPEALAKLTYTEYQKIQFDPAQALWKDERLPFVIEFFHPGFVHRGRVEINVVDSAHVRRVPFSSRMFLYGKQRVDLPPDLGFAVDFAGLQHLPDSVRLHADIEIGEGSRLVADNITHNPLNSAWRLVLEITSPARAVDLRARLLRDEKAVTETWTFTWQP